MNVSAYHSRLEMPVEFQDLVLALGQNGLIPLFQESRKLMSDRLRSLGVFAPSAILAPSKTEVLMTPEADRAILVRYISAQEQGAESRTPLLDMLLISDSELSGLEAIVREVTQVELRGHSWKEADAIERLKERFGELSSNGKILVDSNFRAAMERLYDDALRGNLIPIVSAYGDDPVSRSALERLEQFQNNSGALNSILQDSELVSSRFGIHCTQCYTPHLVFLDRDRAESVIADAGGRCANCGEQKLEVVESYAVTEPYVRGLQLGLWLESLVSDVLAERTNAVWTGQMIESSEIDVLGIFADRTILIECRDTSFSQSDIFETAAKSQLVGADIVAIVTTRDIHQNVHDSLSKMAGGNEHRAFRVISHPSADAIRAELSKILDELFREYVETWIAGRGFTPGVFERMLYSAQSPDEG